MDDKQFKSMVVDKVKNAVVNVLWRFEKKEKIPVGTMLETFEETQIPLNNIGNIYVIKNVTETESELLFTTKGTTFPFARYEVLFDFDNFVFYFKKRNESQNCLSCCLELIKNQDFLEKTIVNYLNKDVEDLD